MKLLSWNIQHGGGTRAGRIVDAIIAHDPDVIALTEYRTKPSAMLCATLRARGWCHIESTNPVGTDNGICVLARTPLRRSRPCPAPPENAVRWLDIDLPEYGFGIGVLHILTAVPGMNEPAGAAKTRFWNAVLTAAEARLGEPFLFVGDFNTGAPYVDEPGRTLACAEHFARLSDLGWTDLWRHLHGEAAEYTWVSHSRDGIPGNGFRIDHAFATPGLLPHIRDCRYSHSEREAGISDHSIIVVEFA